MQHFMWKQSGVVLDRIVEILDEIPGPEKAICLKASGHGFMDLHAEDITALGRSDSPWDRMLSLAHYFTQNGDAMRDPEMTFARWGGCWLPLDYRLDSMGLYLPNAWFEGGDQVKIKSRLTKSARSFASTWLKELKDRHPELREPAISPSAAAASSSSAAVA